MYPRWPTTVPADVGSDADTIRRASHDGADALRTLVAALGEAGVQRRAIRALESVALDLERLATVDHKPNVKAMNAVLSSRGAMDAATTSLLNDARRAS